MQGAAMLDTHGDVARMLQDSAAEVAPAKDLARVRAQRYQQPGFDLAVWTLIGEMGWLGLRASADEGGAGLGMREACALAESLGAGLLPEPVIDVAFCVRALEGEARRQMLANHHLVVPALNGTAAPATRLENGRVQGTHHFVPGALGAQAFLVATTGGAVLVASDAAGVNIQPKPMQDGSFCATVTFSDAQGEPVAADFAGAWEEAALQTAAYLLGGAERCLNITLEYLGTRVQFGKPIGSFQALQHKSADLALQIALTRASVYSAAATLDGTSADGAARQMAVSRAKCRAADTAMLVARQSVQMHGGMGYTDECDVGLYLRKGMVLMNAYGSAGWHRSRYARLALESETQRSGG
ncbi:acyl-CoA dehydrogenase [Hydrogenophaga sp. BPS33]|nr:acyl-CoA dehydrogenase [Hydrogenophaga sp. BPS33]